MNALIHAAVAEGIREVQAAFPESKVETVPDQEGGAFVRVHDLDWGALYEPSAGWVTFRITHAYPHADIYPHHLPLSVVRRDGKPLGEGVHQQDMQLGPFTGPSTMLSRKSPGWNPAVDTAALKLTKVLNWFRELP